MSECYVSVNILNVSYKNILKIKKKHRYEYYMLIVLKRECFNIEHCIYSMKD